MVVTIMQWHGKAHGALPYHCTLPYGGTARHRKARPRARRRRSTAIPPAPSIFLPALTRLPPSSPAVAIIYTYMYPFKAADISVFDGGGRCGSCSSSPPSTQYIQYNIIYIHILYGGGQGWEALLFTAVYIVHKT